MYTCNLPLNLESHCSIQPSPGLPQIAWTEPCSQGQLKVNVKEEVSGLLVDPGHASTRQVL